MASRNKRRGHQRGNTTSGKATRPARDDEKLIEEAQRLEATEPEPEDGDQVSVSEVTGQVDAVRLRRAIAQAETARKRAEQRAATLAKKQDELEAAKTEHRNQVAELQQRKEAVDEAEEQLAERRQELLTLEEEAKRGFARYRQEQLEALSRELDERRAAFEERQRAADAEYDTQRAERTGVLAKWAAELDAHAAELERKELEQRRKERRLAIRQEHLDQEVDDRIRDRLAALETDLELARQRTEGYKQQLEAMRDIAQQRAAELAEYEAARVGGQSLPEIVAERDRLLAENRELREDAAANPLYDRERVHELEARYHDLTVDREELLRQNTELRRHVTASMISATERENARMINEALQRQNDVLTKEIDQQSARLKQMQAVVKDNPPFPACSAMDDNPDYRARPELSEEPVNLRDFVTRVRGRMALDLGLYYSTTDLRCFVAGLAASKLHLLEGISGIGKTRLPEAFAQVIGAGRETIAVAAEWRSPQDLLGYYNAFERTFYESEFTQSLYKAQLPLFREKPFIVVLDEMNLSHPEQYFSDLLSAMERKEADPKERVLLPLMTAPVEPAPELLRHGRAIELPGNIWFIGTANNDETTLRFADKTYDRAHVLELPSKPTRFQPQDIRPLSPVSYKALTYAFDTAEDRHGKEVDRILGFFDGRLGTRLRDDFGVSWGSRLERQARRFIPVIVVAGGTAGEAADHLLATKILRKLSGRVEIGAGELRQLHQDIDSYWRDEAALVGTTPAKSLRMLDNAIRSLGQI